MPISNPTPNLEHPSTELETFDLLIPGFIGGITRRARDIPDEKWNWSFSERTPTAREICEHTFVWLWADRQEITVADTRLHVATPDPAASKSGVIDMLERERREWKELLDRLSTKDLLQERQTTDGCARNIRGYLLHTAQNVVYKCGQLCMIYYELRLDGDGPYDAPYPNRDYGFQSAAPWPSPRQ